MSRVGLVSDCGFGAVPWSRPWSLFILLLCLSSLEVVLGFFLAFLSLLEHLRAVAADEELDGSEFCASFTLMISLTLGLLQLPVQVVLRVRLVVQESL